MLGWKALAALAIVGAVAAFAVYTFGWREDRDADQTRTITTETGGRVYTVRQGDVVRVPAAATECEASQEGGHANLFCTRMPKGRYQVIFYEDSVLVWPLSRGPDGPPFAYRWKPKGGRT
jgi:hypothetical protein